MVKTKIFRVSGANNQWISHLLLIFVFCPSATASIIIIIIQTQFCKHRFVIELDPTKVQRFFAPR